MTQPRPTAAEPATDQELDEAVKLAFEWGQLKLLPRTGWLRAGIEHPESVAEHSLRTAMLAWMLAGLEGANPERAATLALFHDSQETRTTDLDHVGRNYLHATSNEQITADQTAALPRPLAARLHGLVAEYEGRASLEADCARDADKLEMLLQALDYRQRGHGNMQAFIDTAVAGLRTRRAGGWGARDPGRPGRVVAGVRPGAGADRAAGEREWAVGAAGHEKPLCRFGGSWVACCVGCTRPPTRLLGRFSRQR